MVIHQPIGARALGTELRAQSRGHRAQSPGNWAQGRGHRAQSPGDRAQGRGRLQHKVFSCWLLCLQPAVTRQDQLPGERGGECEGLWCGLTHLGRLVSALPQTSLRPCSGPTPSRFHSFLPSRVPEPAPSACSVLRARATVPVLWEVEDKWAETVVLLVHLSGRQWE